MKAYFKYLLSNPMKLIYCLGVIIFISVVEYTAITERSQMEEEWYVIPLSIFAVIILVVALFQPYKEYKDGLN